MTTATGPEAPTDAARAMNVGMKVETKHLGSVQVKELALEQVVSILGDIVLVFSTITDNQDQLKKDDVASGLGWMAKVVQDPSFLAALKKVVGASIDQDGEKLTGMGIKDWLKLVAALKSVMDWEELKELFFQIVPPDALADLKKGLDPTKTP